MKKTVIALAAAALVLGTSAPSFAQEQDPSAPPVLAQDQEQAPQGEELFKKKKRNQGGQPAESAQPQGQEQTEQPTKKRRQKEQVEQPQENGQQPAGEQVEQPIKKRKKEQVEQPQDTGQQPVEEQVEQPIKRRKKKEQVEQPQENGQQPVEEQVEQPIKKHKKEQVEQPQENGQQPAQEQVEQPIKKHKKEQVEQPQENGQQPVEEQVEQPTKRKKKDQAEQPPEPGEQNGTQSPTDQTTGQPPAGKPAMGETPSDVTQYLSDKRPANELSDEELAQRAKRGRDLLRMKNLPDDVRQELAAEARKARAASLARQQMRAGKGDQQQPTAEQPTGQPPVTGEAGKGDQAPVQGEGQSTQPSGEASQPVANPDKKDVQKLDGNQPSPEAEAKAKTYLDDTRSADQLKDDDLRARVDGMRELMAGNQLSPESERALRRRLREEREILRSRVANKVVVEEKQDDELPVQRRRDRDERKWDNWAPRDVLRDRRRSDQLEEGELRRRIDIYRDAIDDAEYDEQERTYWRDQMENDRRYLRDRMVRERRDRERYWHDRRDRNELNININIALDQDREPPESVFMDEIDDDELETYLVAAPRRKINRRYTVEEIEEEPEVRTAMPAVEIDNIHFGFNQAFVREEEVDKLDRIGEVIEKILAAHPREVFLIEGHTDAVGGDAYNLKLSRARAEAVKKALSTYYVIPPRNLKAVGYGERYLKIPTSDAEEENRRVGVRRVTPLVGEAEAGDE
jgi:outer membrane protein OmpA-like peptidoglycan-associated protein